MLLSFGIDGSPVVLCRMSGRLPELYIPKTWSGVAIPWSSPRPTDVRMHSQACLQAAEKADWAHHMRVIKAVSLLSGTWQQEQRLGNFSSYVNDAFASFTSRIYSGFVQNHPTPVQIGTPTKPLRTISLNSIASSGISCVLWLILRTPIRLMSVPFLEKEAVREGGSVG
jgi:hypothetical protein